jgi:NADH-quinone oxidoreductase subunit L
MEGRHCFEALIRTATGDHGYFHGGSDVLHVYELSDTALSFIMVVGAITALFMGFWAL